MLLHSDLKLKRWDPNTTVFTGHSVSPVRSYENALGGGKILSMKPVYVYPDSLMANCQNPYRSLYRLPHCHGHENAII